MASSETLGWYGRCFAGTRGQVIDLLRREERTVGELAQALGITDNAVRAHLATLESDGLVRASGRRPGLRKPHVTYTLTPEAEHLFARAYAPLLSEALYVLTHALPPGEREAILREIGRRFARRLLPLMKGTRAEPSDGPMEQRLEQVAAMLVMLGGLARVEEQDGFTWVVGSHCPLSSVSADDPQVCIAMEAALKESTGIPLENHCLRNGTPRCRFAPSTAVSE